MGYILPINNYTREQYQLRVIERSRGINGVEKPYKIVLYEINPDRESPNKYERKDVIRYKKRDLDTLPEEGILFETGKGEHINVKV